MVAAPLVLLAGGASTSALAAKPTTSADAVEVSTSRAATLHDIALANNHVSMPTTTTVPVTTTPTTTAPVPTPTTVPTTTPPPPVVYTAPTTTTAPPPSQTAQGIATWYYWNAGQCASPWLPHGTVVTVTNQGNGASASCVVTDTEAAGGTHVIDLDASVFQAIAGPAGLGAGAITVTISW